MPPAELFNTFWHGGELSPWHWACLGSFVERGHRVRLFSYRPVVLPPGVEAADAGAVVPERELFMWNDSVSAFSNVFRYELLLQEGGWWIDTDVYCVADALPACRYAWANESPEFVNGAILKFPAGDDVLATILAAARAVGTRVERQGQLGPRLLTAHLKDRAFDAHFGSRASFYPLHWVEAHRFWMPHDDPFVVARTRDASFVHLWDMMFKFMGIDPRVAPPAGSFLERIVGRSGYPRPIPPLEPGAQERALGAIREYQAREGVRTVSAQVLGDGARPATAVVSAQVAPVGRPRLTAIIAAHNEGDVIGHVVRDLAAQGARIYLIDDGSTDDTVAEVERHAGESLIGVDRLPRSSTYTWSKLLARKEELALELDSDWFVHADADEFRESPWPGVGFVEALGIVEALGFNAVDFALLDFWATHDGFRPGDDVREAFVRFAPGAACNAWQIRCWKKTDARVDLAGLGGHSVGFPGRKVFPTRFLLRHCPIRGQAHGERKVHLERRARFDPHERANGWHVQYDAMPPGTSFLRDPATLRPYDPLLVRAELNLRPRTVDELEGAQSELARVQEELARTRDKLARTQDKLERTLGKLARTQGEEARARAQLAASRGEVLGEREALARAQTEVHHLHGLLAIATERADDFEGRLRAVYGSFSWHLTRPLRVAARLASQGRLSEEQRRQ